MVPRAAKANMSPREIAKRMNNPKAKVRPLKKLKSSTLQQRLRNAKAKAKRTKKWKSLSKQQRLRKKQLGKVMYMFSREEATLRYLDQHFSAKDAVESILIPGDSRIHRKTSKHVKNGIGAILDWMVQLHKSGFSLDGLFDLSSWRITNSGFLKGKPELVPKVGPLTDARGANDMKILGDCIEGIFSNAQPIPSDVADLVKVLKNFTKDLYPLLSIHVARESSMRKSVIYTKYYDRLARIKGRDPTKYNAICKKIPLGNWVHNAIHNVHLHRLLRYDKNLVPAKNLVAWVRHFLRATIGYRPTVPGMLDYRRNGEAHLLKDYSFDPFGGLEEAFTAAVAGAAAKYPSISDLLSGNWPMPTSGLSREFWPIMEFGSDATALATAVCLAIGNFKNSRRDAEAAAKAAAIAIGQHQNPTSRSAASAAHQSGTQAVQQLVTPSSSRSGCSLSNVQRGRGW